MKGPFERLKYDLRRVWECPVCHHRERAGGTVTTFVCRCQASKDSLDRVVMKLVEDRTQRRLPMFVPPTEETQPEAPTTATPLAEGTSQEVAAPLAETVQLDEAASDDSPSE